jgi:hypothetical protein
MRARGFQNHGLPLRVINQDICITGTAFDAIGLFWCRFLMQNEVMKTTEAV